MYYRNAQAAVVVYDVTKAASLDKAKSWVKELQRQANPNIVIALAGNKVDLVTSSSSTAASTSPEPEDESDDATATPGGETQAATNEAESLRQVSTEEALAYATEAGLLFFETSAKTGEGVVEVFTEIGMRFFFKYSGPTMSLLPIAKKIPIEHILASTRGANRNGPPGRPGAQQGNVNLEENASQSKRGCCV